MTTLDQNFLNECENFDYAAATEAVNNETYGSDIAEQLELRKEEGKTKIYGVQKNVDFFINLDQHHYARLAMMKAEERGEELSYDKAIKMFN